MIEAKRLAGEVWLRRNKGPNRAERRRRARDSRRAESLRAFAVAYAFGRDADGMSVLGQAGVEAIRERQSLRTNELALRVIARDSVLRDARKRHVAARAAAHG
ncbi:MAG: hypothetical protein IT379_23660 [Deltaproteobacteria bacterium]|nr:hypothetical protein [Deltaproteobacteria bacterium]